MKTFIHLLLIYMLPIVCVAQTGNTKKYDDSQNIDVVVEQEAHYPAGEEALFKYIYENIQYSEETRDIPIIGEVLLSFDVGFDSTLSDITVISGVGYGIGEEIARLLKPLKYAPSIQNGIKVKMNLMLTVPIRVRNK